MWLHKNKKKTVWEKEKEKKAVGRRTRNKVR